MLKKITHILLAVLVCISLVACGEMSTNREGTQQSTEQGVEQSVQTENSTDAQTTANVVHGVQDAVCSVMIKINPQFEVGLNDEYLIVQINYLNEDARQAFSDINVLSLPFDEGILKLLNTLYSKGYMKDHSAQITWAVQIAENTEFDPGIIVNDFEEIIAEFTNRNEVSVSVSMTDFNDVALQIEPKAEQQVEQQVDIIDGREPEDAWELLDNITIEKDASGNIVKYIETDSAGNQSIYNAQKQLICVLMNTENDTRFENDGSETEFFYYANGNRKQIYTLFANGEFTDTYYSESGSEIKYIYRRNLSDGSYIIDYDTDVNGNTDYQYAYMSDGTVWYNEFDINGNQIGQKQIK